jgi:hypothetical protein
VSPEFPTFSNAQSLLCRIFGVLWPDTALLCGDPAPQPLIYPANPVHPVKAFFPHLHFDHPASGHRDEGGAGSPHSKNTKNTSNHHIFIAQASLPANN